VTRHPLFYPPAGFGNKRDVLISDADAAQRMVPTGDGYPRRVSGGVVPNGVAHVGESDDSLRGAEVDHVLDRNWNELLQELRVAQTGTQILTGFLLTVPFSNRFPDLDQGQQRLYLAVLLGSVIATGFNVAPVAYHRILFRRRKRRWLVSAANIAARLALLALALDSAGVVLLVFDVVVSRGAALVASAAVLLFLLLLWAAVPLAERASSSGRSPGPSSGPGAQVPTSARRTSGSTSEP